jgi:hypothetical protein
MVITIVSYDKLVVKKVFNTGSYDKAVVMRSTSSPLVGGTTPA